MALKNILVTGGFGYVGSRLTPHLLLNGFNVRAIDLNLYGDFGLTSLDSELKADQKTRFEFIRGDIRDPDRVAAAMKNINAVIHLAAISNDPTGEVDEVLTRQTNFDAIGVLLATAKRAGVKRFINASSSSVFGIKSDPNVTEILEPEPLTFYSKYKMLSEWLTVAASSDQFCTVNIRPATICGFSSRQRFDLTVNKLTADAVKKRVITVHGGEQRRPNVGMTDVVNLYSQLLKTDAQLISGRTFNFGFENLKVIEIAQLIQTELADLKVEIKVTPTFDNRDYHISSAKIIETIGYKPVSSIRDEIRHLRKYLEADYYGDIDADRYYNMKMMKLERSSQPYRFLAR
jgi:nucleoside-diphosphate-sugar epimerase